MTNLNKRLSNVFLRDEVDACRRFRIHLWEWRRFRLLSFPVAEECFKLLLHRGGIEIAVNRHNRVRWKEVAVVETGYVTALDRIDRVILLVPSVRIIWTIHNAVQLAPSDAASIIVSP